MPYDYKLFDVVKNGHLANITISAPPINIITLEMYEELQGLTEELDADSDLSVIVFKSADPDFFIAHFDVELILSFPTDGSAERSLDANPFHILCDRFRTMDKITIAQVEGRVGGGGNEIISNMDMRFGVMGKTRINQMEVPLGILPGGTGTQNLPRIIGRGRAMEIIVSGEDIDAETAEHWGYLNRIYEADEIDDKVAALAAKIASYPVEAVRLGKQSVDNAAGAPETGLIDEAWYFQKLIRTDVARKNMQKFLEIGGQTREGELQVDKLAAALNDLEAEDRGV